MPNPYQFNQLGGGGDSGPRIDDYAIYVPLSSAAASAETGQSIVWSSPSFSQYGGITGLDCTGGTRYGYITDADAVPTGSGARSYSAWIMQSYHYPSNQRGVGIGAFSSNHQLCSPNNSGWNFQAGGYGNDKSTSVSLHDGMWHHVVQAFDGQGTLSAWVDGQIAWTGAVALDITNPWLFFGRSPGSSGYYLRGRAAALRYWNRALSQAEVDLLGREFDPKYTITAYNLTCSFYQKNQTFGIGYSSQALPVSFEITEGSLPSTISFNTSTGQFTGKGLTDADHVYNLKVKVSAPKSDPVEVSVTVNTYKTARISMAAQTFNFFSASNLQKFISYTADQAVTMAIQSGTLPDHVYFIADSRCFRSYAGSTAADTRQVVVRATSPNNQTGVAATMTLNMIMNQAVLNPQTFKFYSGNGAATKAVLYSGTPVQVSDPVWNLTGTLPAGVTFADGVFSSDASQTADQTAVVNLTLSSQAGTSTPASAEMTIQALTGQPAIPDPQIYIPLAADFADAGGYFSGYTVTGGSYSFETYKGIPCLFYYSTSWRANYVTYGPVNIQGDFTISFWLAKGLNGWVTNDVVFGSQRSDSGTGLTVYRDGGRPTKMTVRMNPVGDLVSVSDAMPDENWHFWAIVKSGDTMTIYRDSSVDATGSGYSSANWVSSHDFSLGWGQWYDVAADYRLAGLRVFSSALDSSQISLLNSEFTPTA